MVERSLDVGKAVGSIPTGSTILFNIMSERVKNDLQAAIHDTRSANLVGQGIKITTEDKKVANNHFAKEKNKREKKQREREKKNKKKGSIE